MSFLGNNMNVSRQWQRSSLKGFVKRMLSYIFGQKCYMSGCKGRLRYKGQYRVGASIHSSVREHWVCNKCEATLGDCY